MNSRGKEKDLVLRSFMFSKRFSNSDAGYPLTESSARPCLLRGCTDQRHGHVELYCGHCEFSDHSQHDVSPFSEKELFLSHYYYPLFCKDFAA